MTISLNIGVPDAAIVVAYLAAVLAFGLWVGRGQRSSSDYFLGPRSLPGWALLLPMVGIAMLAVVVAFALPAAAAIIVALIPEQRKEVILPVGIALSMLPIALSGYLYYAFETGVGEFQFN